MSATMHTVRDHLSVSQQTCAAQLARIAELEAHVHALEQRHREDEAIRRKLHNTIQELKGNIRVYCRVRPASSTCFILEPSFCARTLFVISNSTPKKVVLHM